MRTQPYTTRRNYDAQDMFPLGPHGLFHLAETIKHNFCDARFQIGGDIMVLQINISSDTYVVLQAGLLDTPEDVSRGLYSTRLQLFKGGVKTVERIHVVVGLDLVKFILPVWLGSALGV